MNENTFIKEEWDKTQEIDVLQEGIKCISERMDYIGNINDVTKAYAEQLGIEPSVFKKFKNHHITRGRGWGDDCIDKSEEKISHPDTISTAFRKFFEIIDTYSQCGMSDELKPYIDALANRGITITLDTSITEKNKENKQLTEDGYEIIRDYGEMIWNIDEKINDVLAVDAERQGIVPKNKYKEIVKMMYDIIYGKGKTEKLQERIARETDHNIMHNDALRSL